MADVEAKTSILLQERQVFEVGSDKLEFGNCDAAINRLEPYLGKILLNDPQKEYIGTTEWIPITFDRAVLRPAFWRYLFLLDPALEILRALKSGKRHARMTGEDLFRIKFPLPQGEEQDRIVAKLEPLEHEMGRLARSVRSEAQLIDGVLRDTLGLSSAVFGDGVSIRDFSMPLCAIGAASKNFRSGVNWHHPKYHPLAGELRRLSARRLVQFVSVPISLGATLKPKHDVDESGPAYYASPEALRNERIEWEELAVVSQAFWDRNKGLYSLKEGDILMARSGECAGKRARCENLSVDLIFSDFTMRFRLARSIDREYVWFFVRSSLFQRQVDRTLLHGKGIKNIFPSQVRDLLIVYPSKEVRARVTTRVRALLRSREEQRQRVLAIRREIDEHLLRKLGA